MAAGLDELLSALSSLGQAVSLSVLIGSPPAGIEYNEVAAPRIWHERRQVLLANEVAEIAHVLAQPAGMELGATARHLGRDEMRNPLTRILA